MSMNDAPVETNWQPPLPVFPPTGQRLEGTISVEQDGQPTIEVPIYSMAPRVHILAPDFQMTDTAPLTPGGGK